MKGNKGENVINGIEEEEDVQVQDELTPLAVQKSIIQAAAGKRKSISSNIDLGDLPRRYGLKKQKSGKTPSPKVPKPQIMTVDLDDLTINLVTVQASPLIVQPEKPTPPAAKVSHRVHPLILLGFMP